MYETSEDKKKIFSKESRRAICIIAIEDSLKILVRCRTVERTCAISDWKDKTGWVACNWWKWSHSLVCVGSIKHMCLVCVALRHGTFHLSNVTVTPLAGLCVDQLHFTSRWNMKGGLKRLAYCDYKYICNF